MMIRRFFAAVAFCWCLAGTAIAAEPFYERLLEEGIRAYDAGEHAAAAKSLRLACFGLLEEPEVLAQGLTYLALAQAETGDQAEFTKTFERILEIERRFQAYSQLELDPELRRTFDTHLEHWIALDVLAHEPVFRQAARGRREAEILEMAPDERRRELERLVVSEPENPAWRLLRAELQLDDGDFESALATAEDLLAREPRLQPALCLRARANARRGSCSQALAELDACHELVEQMDWIEARLRCLARLGEWRAASDLLSEVPEDARKREPFRQLGREVRKGLRAAPSRAATETAETMATSEATVTPEATAPAERTEPSLGDVSDRAPEAPAANPPVADSEKPASPPEADPAPELGAELDRIRGRVKDSSREELGEALAVARQLADRYPQLQEAQHLVAEISYRLSRWQEAVTYFRRGGEPRTSHPDRLFYLSVALYETGDQTAARRVLERCLPSLEMTAFVRSYSEKILGDNGS